MYEHLCRLLLENGTRLINTASRSVGLALGRIGHEYQSFHTEVSLNEKIAFELALTGSYASKRAACIFSTEGLYEALDPVMSSAYTGVLGGLLLVCIKETGEEVTPIGPFSKLPLLAVEGAEDLDRAIRFGYAISEKYEIPVIIQAAPGDKGEENRGPRSGAQGPRPEFKVTDSKFVKDPGRWAATPQFRYELHRALNRKIESIRQEFETYEGNRIVRKGSRGVITDRPSSLDFYDEDASVLYLSTIHPLPNKLVGNFIDSVDEVFVAEGPYPAIGLQIEDRRKVQAQGAAGMARRSKPEEKMYGFLVVRDTLGPASSLNQAHGIKKTDPEKSLLAITYEDHFLHSGLAAFVNTLYNGSSYLLLIMVNDKEEELRRMMEGWGFHNLFHIGNPSEIERFKGQKDLTVLFCKGII
jgi:TPP-dependent indolepyruvate ferredoxin oxidoreductase alpha subunit